MAPPWPPFRCSVPDCEYETPEGTKDQMFAHLALHTSAVHLAHQAAVLAVPAVPAARIERLPRPVFSLNMTEAEWQYKEIDWNSYIEQAPMTDNAKLLQLRATCDDTLRQRVCDSGGWSLNTVPELLAKMKELAVVKVHKRKQSDEPVRAFCQVDLSYRDKVAKPSIKPTEEDWEKYKEEKKKGIDDIVKDIEAKESGNLAMISVDDESNSTTFRKYKKITKSDPLMTDIDETISMLSSG